MDRARSSSCLNHSICEEFQSLKSRASLLTSLQRRNTPEIQQQNSDWKITVWTHESDTDVDYFVYFVLQLFHSLIHLFYLCNFCTCAFARICTSVDLWSSFFNYISTSISSRLEFRESVSRILPVLSVMYVILSHMTSLVSLETLGSPPEFTLWHIIVVTWIKLRR